MPRFKFTDGTEAEFEDFKVDKTRISHITLPSTSGKRNGWCDAKIYISAEDLKTQQDAARGGRRITDEKIRAGVLVAATGHPLPKGCYIPFKFSNWGGTVHALDTLTGDYIFNEEIKNET